MTTIETVKGYMSQFCTERGINASDIYNAENSAWYLKRGSANVEVFFNSYTTSQNVTRTFIRCFAPLITLPADAQKNANLCMGALEANVQYMGMKIGTITSKGYMYAIAERDIEGMDYTEFATLLGDLGYWADELDDFLKERFPQ